ncbi:TIGR02679 family protein [Luteolibacter ambystomatis]|uniref:TIGR02679 family protein n=1 Tax=Luteolibacter ambystomatis TaxID=2824561 RepID=A0A975PGG3_9BACT|nr:TIGR02679 family protein [Luteolibacter ambystomatis]QUE52226.1 TIGR02679 family protein [Luteolibacter ambystomatis]
MSSDPLRIQETLGRPELNRLILRLRRRLESGRSLSGPLTLTSCSPSERDALNRLLRRAPSTATSITIQLESLELNLRNAGVCASLANAVEALGGPVKDKRTERIKEEEAWENLFSDAIGSAGERPELMTWLAELKTLGLLRRHDPAVARQLLEQSFKVISRLPAHGTTLAELAASVFGDAHALDQGKTVSNLLLRAVASMGNVEAWDDSEGRRDAWASVGVLLDELSAPVAVLNLRARGADTTSRALNIHADAGEPQFLTIRQLVRTPPTFESSTPYAYVFENKNVLAAAADRLGEKTPPLIATDGQPKTALHVLLRQLKSAGFLVRYHGDFDWPGIRIANAMRSRHGVDIWRMTADDYLRSAAGELQLRGLPADAEWDPALRPAMEASGIAMHEEQQLDEILAALSMHPS